MDASPPKLRSLRATPVNVPLARPHPTASGVVGSAPLVLVDLETDQGLVGHAYVFRRSCPNCRRVPYAHSAGRKPVGTARPDHEPFSGCLRRRHAGRHEDRRDYGLVAGGQPSGGSRFTGVESPVPGTQRAACCRLRRQPTGSSTRIGGTHFAAAFGSQGRFCASAEGSRLWNRVGQRPRWRYRLR